MDRDNSGINDAKLNSDAQLAIRRVVSSLPDEPVSMAWRSGLNEQLFTMAARQQRKKRILWFASPIAGVSLAMALALVMVFRPISHSPAGVPDRGVESAILSDHHASTLSNELSAAGLNLNEVTTDANDTDSPADDRTGDDAESL